MIAISVEIMKIIQLRDKKLGEVPYCFKNFSIAMRSKKSRTC